MEDKEVINYFEILHNITTKWLDKDAFYYDKTKILNNKKVEKYSYYCPECKKDFIDVEHPFEKEEIPLCRICCAKMVEYTYECIIY